MPTKCQTQAGCARRGVFNTAGEARGAYCRAHAAEGMVDVVNKLCQHPGGCTSHPSFNAACETRGAFCRAHAAEGMVDVVHERCQHPGGCTSRSSFNVPCETRGAFCRAHAAEGMVDVRSKRCKHPGCTSRPSFNVPCETRGAYCGAHAAEGMVDVVSKRCQHPGGCPSQPSFNAAGEARGAFCRAHAVEGMVDVRNKRCQHPGGCTSHPSFNLPCETRGAFCSAHAAEGMVNVVSKRCQRPGGCASLNPSFNVPCETRGAFCRAHAAEGMVDVVSKRCQHPGGCPSRPSFNVPCETRGAYCRAHAAEGMGDVVTKRCKHPGCTSQPSFNLPCETRRAFCRAHAEEGMVDVNNKRCEHPGCPKHASFGRAGTRIAWCKDHVGREYWCRDGKSCHMATLAPTVARPCRSTALTHGFRGNPRALVCEACAVQFGDSVAADLVRLVTRTCRNTPCDSTELFLVEGNVWACKAHHPRAASDIATFHRECAFHDANPLSRFVCDECRLAKRGLRLREEMVGRYLADARRRGAMTSVPVSRDRVLPGAAECDSRRRPDWVWETATRVVILEVDEDQHAQYASTCECARISELVGTIGGRSVTIVRFNPDAFVVAGGGKRFRSIVDPRVDEDEVFARLGAMLACLKDALLLRTAAEAFDVTLVKVCFDGSAAADWVQTEDITDVVAV